MTTTDSPEDRVITEGPNAWFRYHDNVVTLAYWLAENGSDGRAVAHAVEKPWHFLAEFIAAKHDIDIYALTELQEQDDNEDTLESRVIASLAAS